jgi:hypothetical protein
LRGRGGKLNGDIVRVTELDPVTLNLRLNPHGAKPLGCIFHLIIANGVTVMVHSGTGTLEQSQKVLSKTEESTAPALSLSKPSTPDASFRTSEIQD